MESKICVITGATSGIGYGIAKELALRNIDIVLLGRNPEKGRLVVQQFKTLSKASVYYYPVDLCSQQHIRQVGEVIKRKHPKIDVLINNAALWTSSFELTCDKIEKQFAVNHLAYFLLTHLLYDNLKQASHGRIINVGSDSHYYGKIYFNNLNLEGAYHGLKAYGQSKLANLLFSYHLHRIKKDKHISVYCVQPGLVKTDIGIKNTSRFHNLMWRLRRLNGISIEKAAQSVVYLATAEDVANSSGLYWDKGKPKPSSVRSKNLEDASRLCKISEELCGIKNFFG